MTLDEALSKVVLGYYARHDGMQEGAYIYYEFDGWRIQFVHDGVKGSSSKWWAEEDDKEANWYISNSIINAEGWPNLVQVVWDIDAAIDAPFQQWKEEVQHSTNQVPMLSDDVITIPYWEYAKEPEPPKPDTVKTGWAIFDKERKE